MAKYKKRADGRYATRITVNTLDGKKTKTVYGRTIKELEDKLARLRTQEVDYSTSDTLLSDWAGIWLDTYKRPTVAYNTYKGYKIAVNDHIIPALGLMRLGELRHTHLQELLSRLCINDQVPTARKVKIALVGIIKTAQREGLIRENIADDLELSGHRPKPKRGFTEKEKISILTSELTDRERALVNLLFYTGVRKAEALALTADDIDYDRRTISINKTLVWRVNQAEVKRGAKTDAGQRVIPLPDKLAPSLARLGGGILFPKSGGGYMSDTAFRRMWQSIRGKCEVVYGEPLSADITPHLFRHNYATMLYRAGVDVKTAQYLLGHSSIQVTLGIYTHLSQEDADRSIDVVNKMFDVVGL